MGMAVLKRGVLPSVLEAEKVKANDATGISGSCHLHPVVRIRVFLQVS